MQTFKFSELTSTSLKSIVRLHEKGFVPEIWEQMMVELTERERQHVANITSSLLNHPIVLMNEATIWGRAIYPLLVLSEQGRLEAWAQVPLRAQYPCFNLEGIADGVVGRNISGVTESYYLIVIEAKRGLEALDPRVQLYGAMLAAAKLNWEGNSEIPQEIFGCYTIADSWTFVHGLVSDFEKDSPAITVASSREYAERSEAETILRILKSVTGKYAYELAKAA
jgi:hypothetical protein